MSRRSSSRRTRSGPRRKLVWARTAQGATVTTVAAPAFSAPVRVDLLSQFVAAYGAALIGCTIVRIRGVMGCTQGSSVAGAGMRAGFYIGDANDIVRGPNANDNSFDSNSVGKDYFGFEPFIVPGTAATDDLLHGTDLVGRMIDIRAMRKLEEVSQRLVLDLSATSVAANTHTVSFDLSILLMLP